MSGPRESGRKSIDSTSSISDSESKSPGSGSPMSLSPNNGSPRSGSPVERRLGEILRRRINISLLSTLRISEMLYTSTIPEMFNECKSEMIKRAQNPIEISLEDIPADDWIRIKDNVRDAATTMKDDDLARLFPIQRTSRKSVRFADKNEERTLDVSGTVTQSPTPSVSMKS